MSTREELQNQSNVLQVQIAINQEQFDSKLNDFRDLQNAGVDIQQNEIELENLRQQQAELNRELESTDRQLSNLDQSEDPTSTVKSPEATNPSESDQATVEKYENAEAVGAVGGDEFGDLEAAQTYAKNAPGDEFGDLDKAIAIQQVDDEERALALANKGIAPGAEKITPPVAKVRTFSPSGKQYGNDLRVRITVPNEYLRSYVPGIEYLKQNFNGIIFPYTPTIQFDQSASYQSQQPLHSNFSMNFYQRSAVSNISITGKFTVQNKQDAEIYIGTVHLLSALTKMKFGNDRDAGAPPPVCRLDAYGTYMLRNVPISISNFRFDLPETVDYFVYDDQDPDRVTSIPIISTLNVTCVLMYSRREMQEFSVDSYVNQYAKQKKLGYL